ncbi:MAG: RHS repeat-associated core domain-containing protein [Caulobacteraceae bacterium]
MVTRGFTGEEMMDDVGLINFNARLYDPQLARFLSADPAIPNDYLDQLLDRYSYVGNNPLSLTDPSGLCFLGCGWEGSVLRDVLAIIVVGILQQYEVLPALEGSVLGMTTAEATSEFALVNAGLLGGVGGLISTGSLKGGVLGSAEAVAFFEVGNFLENDALHGVAQTATTFVAHGAVGGLFTVAEGGNFGSGFLAAGVGSLASAPTPGQRLSFDAVAEGTAESAVLGGVGSLLGGGKFQNGAITGAFGYLFNAAEHAVDLRHEEALLSRLMFAEAAGAPAAYAGIGWTVLNRVGAPGFPNSLEGVIFQEYGNGQYEFNAVGGVLWNETGDPSSLTGSNALSYAQAFRVSVGILTGGIPDPTNGALFFYSGTTPPGFFARALSKGTLVVAVPPVDGFSFLKATPPR